MDKLGRLLGLLIRRWSSKSPKAAKRVQTVSVIAGVVAGAALMVPITYPFWAIAGLTLVVGVTAVTGVKAKFETTDEKIIMETNELFKKK